MEALYKAYKGQAQFLLVYIREAHPVKATVPQPAGREAGPHPGGSAIPLPTIAQPRNLDERVMAASACVSGLKITIPVLLDDMNSTVEKAYGGWPDRLCVIDVDGRVAYHSGPGPAGFNVEAAAVALQQILEKGGRLAGPASQPATQPANAPSTRPAS